MLSLQSVSAGYGSFRALFDVSIDVAAGAAVGVIGPNGAGKTTLMRVISGLIPLLSGDMRMQGRSLAGLPAYHIVEHGIAHVPENRRLFPLLSVEDNLRMGAYIRQARRHYEERLGWVYELFPRLKDRRAQLAGNRTCADVAAQALADGRAVSGPGAARCAAGV
jgi:branched-chain amino acid transport system ATP-binding protein